MNKLFLLLLVANMATHITGNLATKGTYGAWVTQRINLQDGVNVINVSASANGKNTYLDCKFTEPSGAVHNQLHTQLCTLKTNRLSVPWHMDVQLVNDNDGPVTYDIAVETEK
jgi:hypothetical protein